MNENILFLLTASYMHMGIKRNAEPACKPGSVEDSHVSGTLVAQRLARPTRAFLHYGATSQFDGRIRGQRLF